MDKFKGISGPGLESGEQSANITPRMRKGYRLAHA